MALRDELIQALVKAKIASPRLETDIILKHFAPNYPQISLKEEKDIKEIVLRRQQHEPLDKIIGQRAFYKSEFLVNKDVLSPRPDTEILVESALEYIPQDKEFSILDMGTGSGCILLSLLKERPLAKGTGLDVSENALYIAAQNAEKLQISTQLKWIHGSWKDTELNQKFDLIVSNPPYIPTAEINTLEKEVKDYDPLIALDGGTDGLKCYREIAEIAPNILKKGGHILLEVGYNQANQVAEIFVKNNFKPVQIVKDLAGINRCVILKN